MAVAALLAFALCIEWLCAIGVLRMRDAFDRLHYLGPAIIFGPIAIAVAVAVQSGWLSQNAIKSALIAFILLVTSPVLSYVTARTIAVRRFKQLSAIPVAQRQE